ncbi:MAG TPA: alcohol dehydrogenase [Candidatus Binatia bacterium]|jgi:D-arabinose 1-dehydrogenase-like Zn-dependent alcohol dehydrogenase|nr:alcohol dehydrogenase [Candidatus Binatia bacterium]
MKRMKAAQVSKPNGDWELVERDIPEPDPGQVRIKVEACGICHSDMLVKKGLWPGLQYPRIPGHEIAGRIDALGGKVSQWKAGQRVGVGWHGGHCFVCEPCRRGDFILCRSGKITGISHDGGYTEYMISPAEAVAAMPEELPVDEAAPLMCAGITVFNSLRHSGARGGDLVAVQGVGGLGHLGIQYANRMGLVTVALGRGKDKEPLAMKLGAKHYIDSATGSPAEALQKLGGARVILATAPDAKSISGLVGGLAPNGKLLVVAAPTEPLTVSVFELLGDRRGIQGWPSGTAMDSEDTLKFSALSGVRPMIEKFPLAKVAEAYDRMGSGKVRFRAVLTM